MNMGKEIEDQDKQSVSRAQRDAQKNLLSPGGDTNSPCVLRPRLIALRPVFLPVK